MSKPTFPFAVRLIGFSQEDVEAFDTLFTTIEGNGYFRLDDDNLQDPDVYIVNAAEIRALVTLADLRPTDIRPALLIGTPCIELPYMCLERPLDGSKVAEALTILMTKRAEVLSVLEASDIVRVPERRRRQRLDLDLTDPAEYLRKRTRLPDGGAIVVVDRNPAFRDYLDNLLVRNDIRVIWATNETKALQLCEQQQIALVLINTSTPVVDPYRLCSAINQMVSQVKITVIFLISKPFVYNASQAHDAGAEGFLLKPVASHHLISVLKKFLPFMQ